MVTIDKRDRKNRIENTQEKEQDKNNKTSNAERVGYMKIKKKKKIMNSIMFYEDLDFKLSLQFYGLM